MSVISPEMRAILQRHPRFIFWAISRLPGNTRSVAFSSGAR
jgi:hypothetical protein